MRIRCINIVCCVLILCLLSGCGAKIKDCSDVSSAVTNTEGDYVYGIENDTVRIISYRDFNTAIIEVPEFLAEKPVTILGEEAFYQHTKAVKILLPQSITAIEGSSFYRCYSLEQITIPKNVSKIKCNPFFRCSSLLNISVDPENKYFIDIDGVLFNKEKTVLIAYPEGKETNEYTVPGTVKKINIDAFGYHTKLKQLTILSNVVDFPDSNMFVYPDDITLVVEEGSAAEQYAKENNLKYEKVG